MSLIEIDKGALHWNNLKLKRDDGLSKRGTPNSRDTHVARTSAVGQSSLEAQGRYFKAIAKFARLVDKDSIKDRSVAKSRSGRDCSAKFSHSSLPTAAPLMPCYLSPCAAPEGSIRDMSANFSEAPWQGKRVHVAKEIALRFSPSVCRIVPHSKSSTSTTTNYRSNQANAASAQYGTLRSISALTGGVSKSASASPYYVNASQGSTISANKTFLGSFPESGILLPLKWAQVLYTPATPPVASTLPTLKSNLINGNLKPREVKSVIRSNTRNVKLYNQHHQREFQQGENNSSTFAHLDQEYSCYSLSLPRVQLPCVFRPACLKNHHASKIMYNDRHGDGSYTSFRTPLSHGIPSPNERGDRAVLKGLHNKASEKLPGVNGSEGKKAATIPEITAGDNANAKTCIPQQPKQALPSKVSCESTGQDVAKRKKRRSGCQRRFTGVLRDKKCAQKRKDSVCLPIISVKTTLSKGSPFANRNNAALAYVPHPSPKAAKTCVSARTDIAILKNAGNNTKNTNKPTKEKLPPGGAKSRESFLKAEEKIGNPQTKPKIAYHLFDNPVDESKRCSLVQRVNISTLKSLTKLPGLKLSKKVGKGRPRSKKRNGQHAVLCDARKPSNAGGQPRVLRRPQYGDINEEKQALLMFSKRFACARLRRGVGNAKKVLKPVTNKPSTSNSVASVITEEEGALLRAKWAELKFLNLPPPKKPKDDEPPRDNPDNLKGKKTNRSFRSGGVNKRSVKKKRRFNGVQKKKSKTM